MDNRATILSTALRLFAERGYDAVGIQEIVDEAGITKPTLYHYFGSKQGLLEELMNANFAELDQVLQAPAHYQGDLPHTLNQVAAAYFQFAITHRLFYRMQLSMGFAPVNSLSFQVVTRFNRHQQQTIEQIFVLAGHDHGNMKGRYQAYAATFMGMLNTYISLALNDYTEIKNELVYTAVHQYMHGIYS